MKFFRKDTIFKINSLKYHFNKLKNLRMDGRGGYDFKKIDESTNEFGS